MPEQEFETKYRCRGPKVDGGGRIPCGHETTALILAVPPDGKTHIITCPKCGTESKVVRTPPAKP